MVSVSAETWANVMGTQISLMTVSSSTTCHHYPIEIHMQLIINSELFIPEII